LTPVEEFGRSDKELDRMRHPLMGWYLRCHRDLPWRETRDPYRIWVSEVMLQQTRVNTVLPYYQKFLTLFPTVEDLARCDIGKVLKVWEGLGYYARARNLHQAAKIVATGHGGKVPDRWTELRKLPGVGEYIASAVLSIAFGEAYAVVDGNVKRVLARLFLMEDPVNAGGAHKSYQRAAAAFIDNANPGLFNQAVMELGALVCIPRNPACNDCCLRQHCRAREMNVVGEYPKRVTGKPVPTHHVAAGVVRKRGKILITRRPPKGLLGGLWEFPGGKVKKGEDAGAACVREIREETGVIAEIESHLTRIKHAYTHFRIEMDVFCCRHISGKVELNGPEAFRWIRLEEIPLYPFPKANLKFIPLLHEVLG